RSPQRPGEGSTGPDRRTRGPAPDRSAVPCNRMADGPSLGSHQLERTDPTMQRAFALDPIDPGHDPAAAPREGAASIPGHSAGRRPAPLDRAGVRPTGHEAAGLYEAYAARVRGYISFRVRDPDDAD